MLHFFTLCILFFPISATLANTDLLRLSGSNTIGASLAPDLVKAWLATLEYQHIHVINTATGERLVKGASPQEVSERVIIKAHGSSTGFRALLSANADLAMSSRPIKPPEAKALKDWIGLDSSTTETVIGLDGIAIIVHPDNPLGQLDMGLVRDVFSGKITNWSELGGGDLPITLYARDNASGTFDTFRSIVLGKQHPLAAQARRFESNATLSDLVAHDPGAIGFVGLPYINDAKPMAISDGEVAAVAPSRFSVATEDYILARRLFIYKPLNSDNKYVDNFLAFVISKQGQSITAENGFVSQDIFSQESKPTQGAPERYVDLVSGAERLSLNFRFRKGSVYMDSKARDDADRLVRYMTGPKGRGKKLILVGFADSNEVNPMRSLDFSINRADGIADYLIKKKLAPRKVRGFGRALPVASNETKTGRNKNRRVEVWVY